MELTFSELRAKEVVNTQDGKKLGKVCDIALCYPENKWIGIIVPGGRGFAFKRANYSSICGISSKSAKTSFSSISGCRNGRTETRAGNSRNPTGSRSRSTITKISNDWKRSLPTRKLLFLMKLLGREQATPLRQRKIERLSQGIALSRRCLAKKYFFIKISPFVVVSLTKFGYK